MGNQQEKPRLRTRSSAAAEEPNWDLLQNLNNIKSYEQSWLKLPVVVRELLKFHSDPLAKPISEPLDFMKKFCFAKEIGRELAEFWRQKLQKLGVAQLVCNFFPKLWDPAVLADAEPSVNGRWNNIFRIGLICWNISDSSTEFCKDLLNANAFEFLLKILQSENFQVEKVDASKERTWVVQVRTKSKHSFKF